MNKKNKIIAIVIGIMLIVGCILLVFFTRGSKFKIGYVGNNYGNTLNASFKYFSGTESKKVKYNAGDNVKITYTIELEKGELQLKVKDQEGNEVKSESGGSGEVTFTVSETQEYTINVVATKAKGKFNIIWSR